MQIKYGCAKSIFIVFRVKPIVFCFCFLSFFLDLLFAVASLDLKVPMFPANQEEVMLFDVLTQASRGPACLMEKQTDALSGFFLFTA